MDSWEVQGCYPIQVRHEHTSSYRLSRIVSMVLASREVGKMEQAKEHTRWLGLAEMAALAPLLRPDQAGNPAMLFKACALFVGDVFGFFFLEHLGKSQGCCR